MRVFRVFCLIFVLLFLVSCAPTSDSSQIAGLAGTTALAITGNTTLRYTAVYGATPDWLNVSSSAAAGNGRFWQTAVRYENGKNTLFIASIAAEGAILSGIRMHSKRTPLPTRSRRFRGSPARSGSSSSVGTVICISIRKTFCAG
ncbi:MAG: hypothetical protein VB111_10855 [Clostridiaceae bacterium]|nr:hypothetical protein [Clostridiaceae bacterium]